MQESSAYGEALDFEPEDDDLMDGDNVTDADASLPRPKLKSAIIASSTLSVKTKGRGFRQDYKSHRYSPLTGDSDFDSLIVEGGPGPQKSIEGWVILITGVHGEADEEDLRDAFGDYGEIKNLKLINEHREGFVKGALIEYEHSEEAHNAIENLNGSEFLTKTIYVDWAFKSGWINKSIKSKNPRPPHQRSRSPRRRY
ncbi:RNA-binding protein Y14 [Trifolium repens]|nr:RNA-binding protein Y14 [Trifolium repens]